ncbi:uncharacterized protein LOC132631770 [Lycium barbarum]|uniref:uncharacterized protein LOC132631770 n=1 Tax=Lycium barbarum TaxID=112863 RepID=UPI00293E8E91|nr:uncharacterized protein LOC132631770 [Lycium barbarum]
MAQEARLNLRMQRELKLLLTDPPPGASLTSSSSLSSIHAQIEGPQATVYAQGLFDLKIHIPERYPFQPPIVTFVTPIYHPNIDNAGRICLDILNLPPKGAWQPSLNISTLFTSIGLLLSEPNPDDGLMHDASTEYKYNRQAFDHKARSMTQKYAKAGASDFGGHDQEIQTLTNAREGIVEAKELDLPKSESEVPDLFVNQKGLCGLSRKLSLDSAGRAQRQNGETASEVPIDHILNKQMEVSKQAPIEYDLNQDKVQQSTKKLSLEIVSPSKVRNGEKKDYTSQSQCSTSMQSQSIFLNYADIQPLPQAVRNSGETANPNDSDMRNVSINPSRKKLLLNSNDFSQKHEDIEKLQIKPQLSLQLQSTASCPSLSLSGTHPGHDNKQPHKKASDQGGNGLSTRHKKLGLTGRRHPFSTSSSSQRQHKGDKENLAPSHNLPVSDSDACTDSASSLCFTSQIGDTCDAWTRKSSNPCGTSKKLPLQAVEHFGEGKDNSFQLTSHSAAQVNHPLSCEDLCDHKQPNQDEDANFNKNMKQQEKESPKCEAVIVLDSEDSEDEKSLPKRSKLSLARRHVSGKRKA